MANTETKNRKPSHDILFVKGEGDNAYWDKIGAGWAHEDGKGMSLSLDFIPFRQDGRIVIRIRDTKKKEAA